MHVGNPIYTIMYQSLIQEFKKFVYIYKEIYFST